MNQNKNITIERDYNDFDYLFESHRNEKNQLIKIVNYCKNEIDIDFIEEFDPETEELIKYTSFKRNGKVKIIKNYDPITGKEI